ncbi:MAG: hypothetical protein E7522_06025 [Ruminococcaceae bacterium]|nr:hypothetical protein [Oscillospiraceae bacterium]
MKIKAFSFERDSFTLSDVKKSVIDTLDGAGLYFESFSNANSFFEAVSSSMDDNDAVILGIESSLYLKFKPILIKAFNFTPAYSSRIQSRIPGSISDEKTRKAHMLIPNESSELLTPDGLYSGFYIISEGKHIVVLPLKKDLSVNLLKNTDFPFIKKQKISVVSVDEEPTDDILVKAEAVVQKLVDYDLTVAIPTTPAALTLQDRLNTIDGGDRIIFTPFVSDKGITEPKEYSAELARGAKELRNANIGATISTIFREKKGDITLSYYAFIGVAIEDKVVVRKLIATADESVPNLVKEATIELYNLIDKYIDEYVFKADAPEEEIEKYETAQIETEVAAEMRPTASLSRNGMIAAISILVLAVVACIAVGFKFSDYLVSTDDEPETEVLQQQVETTTPGGGELPPKTTLPIPSSTTEKEDDEPSTKKPNQITEFVSKPEPTTSIFDVEENKIPNTTRPQQQRPTTTKPTTTKPTTTKEPETEKPTEEETTKRPGFIVDSMG